VRVNSLFGVAPALTLTCMWEGIGTVVSVARQNGAEELSSLQAR
jgi:hypothetical protein